MQSFFCTFQYGTILKYESIQTYIYIPKCNTYIVTEKIKKRKSFLITHFLSELLTFYKPSDIMKKKIIVLSEKRKEENNYDRIKSRV